MTLYEASGWRIRLAGAEDDATLRALLREVPMEGNLVLAHEREPSFFAQAALHAPGVLEAFLVESEEGHAVGCGSVGVREAWWPDGEKRPVGYIADLRIRPSWRRARVLPRLGRVALERARDRHGAEVFLTALIDGNRRVVGSVTSRSAAREDQPISRPMTPYDMANLPLLGPRPRPHPRVEVATDADLAELARFLEAQQRARTFGYVMSRAALEHRLRTWPGLRIGSFLLLRDSSGGLVGCAAPWTAGAVRQTRVLEYRGWMRAFRLGYDACAALAGAARLPPPGHPLRFAYLSHFEVAGDEPERARALLTSALSRLRGERLHFLAAMVPRASPLPQALQGLPNHRTPMTLFTTTLRESEWSDRSFASTRPGFEMALA